MGWNNFNRFGCGYTEATFRQQADAMVSSGLQAVGYQFINIDDCWSNRSRDGSGNLVADPTKFPGGIKALADYVHGKGLKLGIYTDAGTATCSGFPGMFGHEQQDANLYAAWGIDYVKVDWCSSAGIDAQTEFTLIGNALRSSGRAMVYSVTNWGQNNVWDWGPGVGNLWRTTGDISDSWTSMLSNFDPNATHASSAGPGGWNDPDMLEVGNGGMSTAEDQAHFSLWAISAAPLILGNDMASMSAATRDILTNAEVIAVDQDSLGVQGIKVADNGAGLQVWSKRLAGNGNVAVVLLNRSASSANVTVNWSSIGLSGSANVRDLVAHIDRGAFSGSYTANVPSHGVVMVKISNGTAVPPTATAMPTHTPTVGVTPIATPPQTPTVGVTPIATSTNTPTQLPGGSCRVSYTITNQWAGGFGATFSITNTGTTAINGWTLTFTFPNGQTISQLWNGSYTQSAGNVTITNLSYNGSLSAGATLLSPPGFNGSWNGSNGVPTAFRLNGVNCSIG